ncbi:hypothetical protein Misp01_54360 [Microtetraspora sp. NBRC 13810]|uniref:SMI1/KNR4 family protein n=1 Tax=Microtetraspora sp. NBRC 13810 TaxID=3030990 RepID=UPI0024A57335|nr:SMI1/KNR4 family protein [Microtetraspora sp. NBRC 13810]GLW10308.1 hypothetical protein Misp01_54360 [Microtetraspora sp. NBRC 13810]
MGFDYRDGAGVDFEPYPQFLTAADTAQWWRAWMGNPSVDGAEFRVFGQDGTGGMAAFWLVRSGEPLTQQPVVFLDSEGRTGLVARNLDGYLWLIAAGFGPFEAMMYPTHEHEPRADARLTQIAERWAPSARQPAAEVIGTARQEFPYFDETVESLCR